MSGSVDKMSKSVDKKELSDFGKKFFKDGRFKKFAEK